MKTPVPSHRRRAISRVGRIAAPWIFVLSVLPLAARAEEAPVKCTAV
jgi:hypothetical protein